MSGSIIFLVAFGYLFFAMMQHIIREENNITNILIGIVLVIFSLQFLGA